MTNFIFPYTLQAFCPKETKGVRSKKSNNFFIKTKDKKKPLKLIRGIILTYLFEVGNHPFLNLDLWNL